MAEVSPLDLMTSMITGEETKDTEYDRSFSQKDFAAVVAMLGVSFSPADRANYYFSLSEIMRSDGVAFIRDVELALLMWAPNDHLASQAVADGDERFIFNPSTYKLDVSHDGNANAALRSILELNGYQQPGGAKGVLDDVYSVASGLGQLTMNQNPIASMFESEKNINPFNNVVQNNDGRSMFNKSNLIDLMDVVQSTRRSTIPSMQTTGDRWHEASEITYTISENLILMFMAPQVALRGIKAVPAARKAVAATDFMTWAAKTAAWDYTKMFGTALKNIRGRSALGASDEVIRGFAALQYRLGKPLQEYFMSRATQNGAYNFFSKFGPRSWGTVMGVIGFATVVGASKMSDMYLNPEKNDEARLEYLEEQQKREGLTPEEAEEKKLVEQRIKDQATTDAGDALNILSPTNVDMGVQALDTPWETIDDSQGKKSPVDTSFSVASDSWIAQNFMGFSNEVNTITAEAARRVNFARDTKNRMQKASFFQAATDGDTTTTTTTTEGDDTDDSSQRPPPGWLPPNIQRAVDEILKDKPTDERTEYLTDLEYMMQSIMKELGLEYFDEETMFSIEQVNIDRPGGATNDIDGWTLMQDISSPKSEPKEILLPPGFSAFQFDEYVRTWEDPLAEEPDPLIRVPEGWSARTFKPLSPRRAGGSMLPTGGTGTETFDRAQRDENYFLQRSGQDQYTPSSTFSDPLQGSGGLGYDEAMFITRAQGSPYAFEESDPVAAQYRESHILNMVNSMTFLKVMEFQSLAGEAGLYGTSGRPLTRGYMSSEDQDNVAIVMGQANVDGETFWSMLRKMASNPSRFAKTPGKDPSIPTSPARLPYSVPTSLRSIPGPKTLAEQSKALFEQKLGRQARPDELAGISAEMSGSYTTQNQQLIALDMARYDGDNQGLITGAQFKAIEDPQQSASFDIANKWKDEINLNDRRESNATTFQRIINATAGNRASIGNQTAAGNVQQIGRV